MNRIRLLSEQVANQIAAGEVVERPASVVKELVENAIDANASHIEVEIRNGGRSFIRVTDNGFGMSRDDALLALERHATSKITRAEDLTAIATLGFRGEALPSLAAVSRFRLVTREPETLAGTEIEVAGGKILNVRDVGCPTGTHMEVRNLFFNLPARRKFLRTPQTEIAWIHQVCVLQALARPGVAFRFLEENRTVFDLAPANNLRGRLRELYNADFVANLAPVEWGTKGLRVSGFIGRPGISRSNRSDQHLFVNARPIESRAINFALLEGYHTALMKGRYPVAFLFLELDPHDVDINVHPTKREVRFRDEASVRAAVISAVRSSLGKGQESGGTKISVERRTAHPAPPIPGTSPGENIFPPEPIALEKFRVPPNPQQSSLIDSPVSSAPAPPSLARRPSTETSPGLAALPFRILGVLSDLYILAEGKEGLVMIDQHAAHERVLFEQMLSHLEQGASPSQKLLLPQTITLDPRDAAFLKEHLDVLQGFGFGLADFGSSTILVESLPPYLSHTDLRQLLIDAIDRLRESGRGVSSQRLREESIATTVCRHAVKARDPLQREELERLLRDLLDCDLPYTCPHGRPTMIQISHAELEKKFGRRV